MSESIIDWNRFSDDVLRDFRSMALRYPDMNKLLIEAIDQEIQRRKDEV